MGYHLRKCIAVILFVFCLALGAVSQSSAFITPLNDDTEFVKQVYLDFLNREPDAGGLAYWAGLLSDVSMTRAEMVEQYLLSAEFQGNIAPVVRLYFTYYLRIPDYGGLMFWVNSYAGGMSLYDISDAFATAPEFTQQYGSLTNEEFVSQMYVNVYGREPDTGGLAFWAGLLNSGDLTRGQVMVEFASAEEYLLLSANQVYVTMTYMGLLRRAPEQGGFDFWVDAMDGGESGLGLIEAFLTSPEYADRFDINVDDDGDGYTESQGDCSDLDANTYPGAAEICGDGVDQDCSGADLSCPSRYQDNGNGTITDKTTGLIWQQSDNGTRYTYAYATSYCENLSLAGKADWRLPTKDELKSLVVCSDGTPTPLADYDPLCLDCAPYSCGTSPTIAPSFSCQSSYSYYWSSSISGNGLAWYVYFYSGLTRWPNATGRSYYVRCVR